MQYRFGSLIRSDYSKLGPLRANCLNFIYPRIFGKITTQDFVFVSLYELFRVMPGMADSESYSSSSDTSDVSDTENEAVPAKMARVAQIIKDNYPELFDSKAEDVTNNRCELVHAAAAKEKVPTAKAKPKPLAESPVSTNMAAAAKARLPPAPIPKNMPRRLPSPNSNGAPRAACGESLSAVAGAAQAYVNLSLIHI